MIFYYFGVYMENEEITIKKYSEFNASDKHSIGLFVKGANNQYPGTVYVRLLSTFNLINNEKNNFIPYIIDEKERLKVENDIINNNFALDFVIIQRDVLDEKFAKLLINRCKENNIKIIYEIDDDLLNIDNSHPEFDIYKKKAKTIEYIIKNSDSIVVSTSRLKEKLLDLNSNIYIIPNTLTSFWNAPIKRIPKSKDIKIGYMGTTSHTNDIKLIEAAILKVKDYFKSKGQNITFEIIGGTNDNLDWAEKIQVPTGYHLYPLFVNWLKKTVDWTIAVAPLEKTNINSSKSEIKYLEYSALGVPAVFTDFGPYHEHIKHGNNGLLVKDNDINEWVKNIIDLIEDKNGVYNKIIKNSREDIDFNYNMNIAFKSWLNVLNNTLGIKNSSNSISSLKFFSENESYDIIKNSGLFDIEWYLSNYNDVKLKDIDPITHYLNFGVYEGCNPNSDFNTIEYMSFFKDLTFSNINPFVHYIINLNTKNNKESALENKGDFSFNDKINNFIHNDLSIFEVNNIIDSFNKKISIIIPIYNAFEDTQRCIESVLKNTTVDYNLILINDNSSDDRIKPLLEKFNLLDNVQIFNNKVNNGFTKNVNFGIRVSGDDDVILLNSDTIVTPFWIQKILFLAYSQDNIGTITPFSNASDISVPVFWDSSKIPSFEEVNKMGAFLFNSSCNEKLISPTGNGYCLFIKRKTIYDVGLFDEDSFKNGYGEETDFTMRANKRGWLNVRYPSVFIYHKKSASFSLEKANKLKKEHKKIILEKHPTVFKEWDKFYNSEDIKKVLSKFQADFTKKDNKLFQENILFITTLKNNVPFIEPIINDLLKEYNIFCLTYDSNEYILWYYKNMNDFELIYKIKINGYDIGDINQFFINLIYYFNFFKVLLNHSLMVSTMQYLSNICPFKLLDKIGLSLNYVRPNRLNSFLLDNNSSDLFVSNFDFKKNKCVVYTAITGGYDNLNDPEYIDPDFDYICFTDNPNLKSNVWDIRFIKSDELNPIKKARKCKILAHEYLKEYSYSIWVDGSFKIIGNLKDYINTYLNNNVMIFVKHIRRNCIFEESKACINLKKDNLDIINYQMKKYSSLNYPISNGLVETGFIFRKHDDDVVIKLMADWYNEVDNNSVRDQLSLNFVAWKNNINLNISDIIIWRNQYIENVMSHNE